MSTGSGDGYSADLWDLYDIGRTDIMALAEDYNTLASGIAETSSYSIDPPPISTGVGSRTSRGASALRSGAALAVLRQELQFVFAVSCVNVGSAATALMETATAYAAADEEVGADFDAQMSSEYDGSEASAPPQPPFPDGRGQLQEGSL